MFKYEIMMKKNIIRAALFAVFAFVAGYGVYTSQKETAMSDLAMANVEALAGECGSIGRRRRSYCRTMVLCW